MMLFFAALLYLLPSMIAFDRKHKNLVPVMLVNIILGWTLAGWLVALIWAFTSNVKDKKCQIL